MDIQQTNLIKLLRCVLLDAPCERLTEPDYSEITELAKIHKLSSFLFEAIPHLSSDQIPSGQMIAAWRRQYRSILVLEANQRYEYERLSSALSTAQIKALPVKGFSVADLYPKSYLRTMSDLDILYDAAKQNELVRLMQELGYRAGSVGSGNTDQFFTEHGIHVEMHRSLWEDRMPSGAKVYLTTIFDRASAENDPFSCFLSTEDSYLYLLLHTYKHFIFAGTGIRSVLDVFLYKKLPMDQDYLKEQFRLFGISKFVHELSLLSDVWFSDAAPSEATPLLENYIFSGTVYGSEENKLHSGMIHANNGRGAGKLKYMLSRFFLPPCAMKSNYPVLKKLPFLLPFFWAYRAFYALIHRRDKLKAEIHNIKDYDSSQADRISDLMRSLDITR